MPRVQPNPDSSGKVVSPLQLSLNSLKSSSAEPEPAQSLSRTGTMNASRSACRASLAFFLLLAPSVQAARASKLTLLPGAPAILDKIYSFDLDGAVQAAKHMQQEQPDHPLGYLLETEALWWRIWCTSAEFKFGMSDARRRAKLPEDRHYFDLAAKALSLAEAQLKQRESAEMHFYAGMADASLARLYGLRGESRNAARTGVRGREHFLHAKALDPDLADADLGLGLYNYYVDTLSSMARVLRFFMGIPGGDKRVGMRQLERAMKEGELTRVEARFYLAKNLRNYDREYERAAQVSEPLVAEYPQNPIFHLLLGDINAKLRRKEKAAAHYGQAAEIALRDPDCQRRIGQLAAAALAALGIHSPASTAP